MKFSLIHESWMKNPRNPFPLYTYLSILQTNKQFLYHKMAENGNKDVCCCCWERFSSKSKSLLPVNNTVEDLMKLFIYPGYSREVINFPKTICNTCQRNLYRLMKEEGNRGAWNEKISKVRYYLFSGHLFQSHLYILITTPVSLYYTYVY